MLRRFWFLVLAAFVASTLTSAGAWADDKDVSAVIEKAIKARGGADKIANIKTTTAKSKGKFYGTGDALEYTATEYNVKPNKQRSDINFEINGMKAQFIQVFTGTSGWRIVMGNQMDFGPDENSEFQAGIYFEQVTDLIHLKDKTYTLASAGEGKVGNTATVGVRVTAKDKRDVMLHFGKDTGMLVKAETRVKNLMAGGEEVTQEVLFSDFKEIGGVKHAMKVVINRDGKVFVESETTDLKVNEKIDPKLFEKP